MQAVCRPREQLQFKSKGSLLAEFLSPRGMSGFFLQTFSWLDEAHPPLWRAICFTQIHWFKCKSHPKTPSQKHQHNLWPAKLTHKINYHSLILCLSSTCTKVLAIPNCRKFSMSCSFMALGFYICCSFFMEYSFPAFSPGKLLLIFQGPD